MNIFPVAISKIDIGKRVRSPQSAHIKALADSINEIGLQYPITVVEAKVADGGVLTPMFRLVTGYHRLQACKQLGHIEIQAIISSMSELDRQLWEIDENLVRADLSELERADHLAMRKDIYEARHPEAKMGGAAGKAGGGKIAKTDNLSSFAKDTADKIGLDERTIRRSVRRAERIVPEAKALLAGTDAADSGVELDSLASAKQEDQVKIVKAYKSGKAESLRDARAKISPRSTPPKPTQFPSYRAAVDALDKATSGIFARMTPQWRIDWHWACIDADKELQKTQKEDKQARL